MTRDIDRDRMPAESPVVCAAIGLFVIGCVLVFAIRMGRHWARGYTLVVDRVEYHCLNHRVAWFSKTVWIKTTDGCELTLVYESIEVKR